MEHPEYAPILKEKQESMKTNVSKTFGRLISAGTGQNSGIWV